MTTPQGKNQEPRARILVVEDDPAILRGLMDVLVFNGYKPQGADHGTQGLDMALNNSFDLVILDVMLPGMDGFTICRKIRETKPAQGIVMLTAKGSEEDVVTGFSAGADDYVSKPFSLRELMVRIEAVLRRTCKQVTAQEVNLGELVFSGANLTCSRNGESVPITRREMDIISYLHTRKDRIVSKKELLCDVWHYADSGVETRTVEIHIQKLRKKIAVLNDGKSIIETIRGEGYRLL